MQFIILKTCIEKNLFRLEINRKTTTHGRLKMGQCSHHRANKPHENIPSLEDNTDRITFAFATICYAFLQELFIYFFPSKIIIQQWGKTRKKDTKIQILDRCLCSHSGMEVRK